MSAPGATAALGLLESEDLYVYPYRCIVMRNRNARCMRCADACTSGAISVTENEIVVDPELCVGCGTCATVCPTCALEARHPNDALLSAKAESALFANDHDGVIVCNRLWEESCGNVDEDKVARVTCLGRVEETLLTGLAALGAKSITMAHGECASCPRCNGHETYEMVVETANRLLEVWQAPVRVECVEGLPEVLGVEPAPNLDYAANGETDPYKGEAPQKPDTNPYTGVMHDGTLPHFLPDRRERLLDNLAELGEPDDAVIESRLWGRVCIETELCKTCFVCATFCPTGALKRFKVSNEKLGVDHSPCDCVKCGCCAEICPTGALTLNDDVLAREVAQGSVVERFYLPPITDDRGGAHSIYGALRKLIKIDQFYER